MPEISNEALFRFQVVSQVLSLIAGGERKKDAINDVAEVQHHCAITGVARLVSPRTVDRWLTAYDKHGLAGLERRSRRISEAASAVLSKDFIELLRKEKDADATTSIPEIIKVARAKGILTPQDQVDRTTVYRVARRLGLPVAQRRAPHDADQRRFAYPHRMDAVLCDGKHFRAGPKRARRVALFFLDDATRRGLHVVVGTSESAVLFLRGLYELLLKYGKMTVLYLDHGPGFIAGDTLVIVGRLGIHLIHGTKAYPEGHGKIERFNRTVKAAVLRRLDGRPGIDPACHALELRLQHYLDEQYNRDPHEKLDNQTPRERFDQDHKELVFFEDRDVVRKKFEVTLSRRVSKDNVVSIDSVDYEMPGGYRGARVLLRRKILDGGRVLFCHQGRFMELHPVDLAANARSRRVSGTRESPPQNAATPRPSAADIAFENDYGPVVDADGGYSDTPHKEAE